MRIHEEPTEEEVDATIEPVDNRHVANLNVGWDFWRKDPEDQRATIVHELLHLLHRDASDVIRNGAWRQEVPYSLYNTVWEQYRTLIEICVDDLTTIISQFMPLPPWAEVLSSGPEVAHGEEAPSPQGAGSGTEGRDPQD